MLKQLYKIFILGVHTTLALPVVVTSCTASTTYHKAYATVIMAGVIYMTVWQMCGKIAYIYPDLRTSAASLDSAGTVLIAIFDIYDTVYRTFINERLIMEFYGKLRKADKFLGFPHVDNYFVAAVYRHWRFIVGVHCITAATFIFDVYCNGQLYGNVHVYNAVNIVLKYKFVWTLLHLHMSASGLRHRFAILNSKFQGVMKSPDFEYQALKCMKCHDLLSDVISTLNRVYSVQILIMDKIIALNVVETSCLCLSCILEETTHFSVTAFINNFIWSLDFMSCGALICFSLGRATKGAQSILVVCQNLYKKYGVEELRGEVLVQFCRQVATIGPEICCLGFLAVNYSLFFKMLVTIFNYIVIVLQFDG